LVYGSRFAHDKKTGFLYNVFMFQLLTHTICYIFIYFALLFVPTSDAQAVWEHSPVSEATRLSPERFATWEFGMIFNSATIYPAEFYCPGNVRAIIHVLNVSPTKITIRLTNSQRMYIVQPGMYKKIDFGIVSTGDHLFFLDLTIGYDTDPSADENHENPGRLKCYIHAARWPGPHPLYRAAGIINNGRLTPKKIIIPAGRKTDFFLGTSPQDKSMSFTAREHKFMASPGRVTLTEIYSPAGGEIELSLPEQKRAILSIR
jgi:hypothetical protein